MISIHRKRSFEFVMFIYVRLFAFQVGRASCLTILLGQGKKLTRGHSRYRKMLLNETFLAMGSGQTPLDSTRVN